MGGGGLHGSAHFSEKVFIPSGSSSDTTTVKSTIHKEEKQELNGRRHKPRPPRRLGGGGGSKGLGQVGDVKQVIFPSVGADEGSVSCSDPHTGMKKRKIVIMVKPPPTQEHFPSTDGGIPV